MGQRILVVEDEPAIAESVAYALTRDGFAVEIAATAAAAAPLIAQSELVILDLMLPDDSGFNLISRARGAGVVTPIIVLSSRDDESDRVAALEAGADDYVTKPFSPREVVARVRAVLRRVHGSSSESHEHEPRIRVDLSTRRAYVEQREL
ncbi:MAG TPA: response regulator transcription factor, partial [Polyangiaceae bacterium]|nr:response regulator transcription factor [Polyangiaceae bacterium]